MAYSLTLLWMHRGRRLGVFLWRDLRTFSDGIRPTASHEVRAVFCPPISVKPTQDNRRTIQFFRTGEKECNVLGDCALGGGLLDGKNVASIGLYFAVRAIFFRHNALFGNLMATATQWDCPCLDGDLIRYSGIKTATPQQSRPLCFCRNGIPQFRNALKVEAETSGQMWLLRCLLSVLQL